MDIERALKMLDHSTDEGEVYSLKARTNSFNIKKGEVDVFKEDLSSGYCIRAIKNKKMGFSFSNSLSKDVINTAVKNAGAAERDEHISLPLKQKYRKVKGGYDRRVASLGAEESLGFVELLVQPCEEYKVEAASGALSWSSVEIEIMNTNGVTAMDRETSIYCYLSTVAKNGDVATGSYFDVSRNLDIDFQDVGERASKLARESLNPERVGTLITNVTLRPHAVSELFDNALIPSFSADNVQRGRSILKGKLGQKVFFEHFNIVDDGTMEKGLETSRFDDEGVETHKTPLVKDGVLVGYLYDTYTANKGNEESTGNAARGSYTSPVGVGPSNFVISGGGEIAEEGLAVYGLIGAHTSNPISGDFSVETRNAFLNGKPVKKAIISGNIFELLNKIEGFGEDYRQVSPVCAPSIQFREVRVVG